MNQMISFEQEQGLLFQTDLQPIAESLDYLRNYEPVAEVSTILGKVTGAKCIIGISKPICIPLDDCFQLKGIKIPNEVRGVVGNTPYSFFVVRFACSFLVIKNCRVGEARLDVQLRGSDEGLGVPLALDLLPRKVVTPSVKETKEKKISTQIGANLKFFEANVGGEYITGFEHQAYEPEIISYGVQTRNFRWKFIRTKYNLLEGDQILFATIAKPVKTQVMANFRVAAEVQTTAFKNVILDSRNDNAANISYILM